MNNEMNIVIVNTGVSNVRSVANMLKRLKVRSIISDNKEDIAAADVLILPGVGAFDTCIDRFLQAGLIDPLNRKVLQDGVPAIGLCLGMQILGDHSEEGKRSGLGWIPGHLQRLEVDAVAATKVRVPHMGWNIIENTEGCLLYAGMGLEPRFYFDHSYYFTANSPEHVCGTVRHGIEFAAGIHRGNIFGVQFHPEKSHRFGLALFRNFIEYARTATPLPQQETRFG